MDRKCRPHLTPSVGGPLRLKRLPSDGETRRIDQMMPTVDRNFGCAHSVTGGMTPNSGSPTISTPQIAPKCTLVAAGSPRSSPPTRLVPFHNPSGRLSRIWLHRPNLWGLHPKHLASCLGRDIAGFPAGSHRISRASRLSQPDASTPSSNVSSICGRAGHDHSEIAEKFKKSARFIRQVEGAPRFTPGS